MKKQKKCKTQKECDEALKDGLVPILIGSERFSIYGNSYVEARESSHVGAWGRSHVVALERSHVVAWESSHVEARGSSHVEAWGRSHVVACESSHVVASRDVAVHQQSDSAKISGGVVIAIKKPETSAEWCDYYGVKIQGECAIVFKAVSEDFKSAHGILYLPGTMPSAPDWDGGIKECGGGLHFVAHPLLGLRFDSSAVRFVACPVKLSEIVIHKNAEDPSKIKAPCVAAPIYEVDRYGKPLESLDQIFKVEEAREKS